MVREVDEPMETVLIDVVVPLAREFIDKQPAQARAAFLRLAGQAFDDRVATLSPSKSIMVFGQPWHVVKKRLPAPLVAETEAWIGSKENTTRWPPNGLVQRLHDAFLKANIEIFPL